MDVRERQRRDRELALPGEAQRDPAGDEQVQPWAVRQQRSDGVGRGQHVLEVVEQHQRVRRPEPGSHSVGEGPAAHLLDPERLGDRADDQAGVADVGERDEHHAVGEGLTEPGGGLDRQAGLADAARPEQGHEALDGQRLPHDRDLLFATDEAAQRRRQGADGAGRLCLDPRRGAFEHRAVGVRQRERFGQSAHRRRVGVRPGAPLEIGDAAGAHRRALGEGLLCEPGRDAVAPEDVAEPGPLPRHATAHRHRPPDGVRL